MIRLDKSEDIMQEERTPDLTLPNGLKIFYDENPNADGFSLNMFLGSKATEDNKEVIFAANHIIEHSIRLADKQKAVQYEQDHVRPQDCITSYDNIRFGKYLEQSNKLAETMNCYGDIFSNWHTPDLEDERQVIFEEWCNSRHNGNPAFLSAFLGGKDDLYTLPEKNITLLKPEYVEQHKDTTIKKWYNNQINYTKDLKTENIIDYAKHICGADNMTFVCSGKMPKEEFIELIKASTLGQIPQTQKYNPFENITDKLASQNLSSQMDIDDYKTSAFEVTYSGRDETETKIAKEFFKLKMGKKLQKEEPHAYIIDFTKRGISAKITAQKEKIMQDKLVSLMASSVNSFSLSETELKTLQTRLGINNLSPETVKTIASQTFQTAKLSINNTEPKSISNLAYFQKVKEKIKNTQKDNHSHQDVHLRTPVKIQQVSIDLAKLKRTKEM